MIRIHISIVWFLLHSLKLFQQHVSEHLLSIAFDVSNVLSVKYQVNCFEFDKLRKSLKTISVKVVGFLWYSH